MPAGLQIWDENGVLILDITTNTLRAIGQMEIASTSLGSISDYRFANGDGWFIFLPLSYSTIGTPSITFTSSSMTWGADVQGYPYDGLIIYGVR